MHAARRSGNVGLVHKYHDRKKHGYRCSLGRHFEVCHCYYSIQKQKGGSILCRELRETVDERDHQSYHAAKAEASLYKVYVDGANPEVIRELKARIGEYHDYYGRLTEEQIWGLRTSNSWQIIPVNFQKRHRQMLQWTYTLMSKGFIRFIHYFSN